MNKKPTLKESELNDFAKYAKLMKTLPINNEKDEGLAIAFEDVERIESMLEKGYSSGNSSAIANAAKLK